MNVLEAIESSYRVQSYQSKGTEWFKTFSKITAIAKRNQRNIENIHA